MIPADGIQAAADRELEFHPTRKLSNGREIPISAWDRRAKTLQAIVVETNALREELDAVKGVLASRPF